MRSGELAKVWPMCSAATASSARSPAVLFSTTKAGAWEGDHRVRSWRDLQALQNAYTHTADYNYTLRPGARTRGVMRRAALILVLCVVVVLGTAPGAAATHYVGWHFYRAPLQVVTIYVVDHTTADYDAAVTSAATNWTNLTSKVQMIKVEGTVGQNQCDSPSASLNIDVCNGGFAGYTCAGTTAWVGCFTRGAIDASGHIDRGTVWLKDPNSYKQNAVCQELGHFSLNHRMQTTTCMYPYSGPYDTPDGTDKAMLEQDIYAYPDGYPNHNPGCSGVGGTGVEGTSEPPWQVAVLAPGSVQPAGPTC